MRNTFGLTAGYRRKHLHPIYAALSRDHDQPVVIAERDRILAGAVQPPDIAVSTQILDTVLYATDLSFTNRVHPVERAAGQAFHDLMLSGWWALDPTRAYDQRLWLWYKAVHVDLVIDCIVANVTDELSDRLSRYCYRERTLGQRKAHRLLGHPFDWREDAPAPDPVTTVQPVETATRTLPTEWGNGNDPTTLIPTLADEPVVIGHAPTPQRVAVLEREEEEPQPPKPSTAWELRNGPFVGAILPLNPSTWVRVTKVEHKSNGREVVPTATRWEKL